MVVVIGALDWWGRTEFLASKFDLVRKALGAVYETIVVAISAPIQFITREPIVRWVLLAVGLVWIYVGSRGSDTVAAKEVTPPARLKPAAMQKAALALLDRAHRHGSALYDSHQVSEDLAIDWARRTRALLEAMYGPAEGQRFDMFPDTPGNDAHSWLADRLNALLDLIRRREFTIVRSDFDPDRWQS